MKGGEKLEAKDLIEDIRDHVLLENSEIDPTFARGKAGTLIQFSTWKGAEFEIKVTKLLTEAE